MMKPWVTFLCLMMVACQDMDPSSGQGHASTQGPPVAVDVSQLQAGRFVVVSMDNAGFFNELPTQGGLPDLLLRMGTSMRVISSGEAYCKVELDNGRVGYVAVHQLSLQGAGGDVRPQVPAGGAGGIPPIIAPPLPPLEPGL